MVLLLIGEKPGPARASRKADMLRENPAGASGMSTSAAGTGRPPAMAPTPSCQPLIVKSVFQRSLSEFQLFVQENEQPTQGLSKFLHDGFRLSFQVVLSLL
jgi:hypothetical protein